MGGDSEYEPKDSRNVTGTAQTRDGRWSGDADKAGHGGEYEPRDSRNVTGTASTPDGRWTNRDGTAPRADGEPGMAAGAQSEADDEDEDDDEDGEPVTFEPDPALTDRINATQH
jgi:hypothetical protein